MANFRILSYKNDPKESKSHINNFTPILVDPLGCLKLPKLYVFLRFCKVLCYNKYFDMPNQAKNTFRFKNIKNTFKNRLHCRGFNSYMITTGGKMLDFGPKIGHNTCILTVYNI